MEISASGIFRGIRTCVSDTPCPGGSPFFQHRLGGEHELRERVRS